MRSVSTRQEDALIGRKQSEKDCDEQSYATPEPGLTFTAG